MKSLDSDKKAAKPAEEAPKAEEKVDFSNVKIEPIFKDMVDFETFAKSDFRAVKILACEAVPKSKKLLKFTLDDGERKDRVILSGIHEYYEPEELVGKTAIAIGRCKTLLKIKFLRTKNRIVRQKYDKIISLNGS